MSNPINPLIKQSLSTTLINYVGVLLGIVSTIWIYPRDFALYGSYGFLTNLASVLAPFVSLGFGAVLIKFIPYFQNNSRKEFLRFVAKGVLSGIVLFIVAFGLFYNGIVQYQMGKNSSIVPLIPFILPLTILYVCFECLNAYSLTKFKMVIPSILSSGMKIILPILFLLTLSNHIDSMQFIFGIIIYYFFANVILFLTLLVQSKNLNEALAIEDHQGTLPGTKEMLNFALFSIIGGVGSVLALRIDSIFIGSFLGTEANGQFTLAYFISNASYIPANAISDILNPKISFLSKAKDEVNLLRTYRSSTINMLIPSLWTCLGLALCFPYLAQLMPNSSQVKLIFPSLLFLLSSRLVDAITGTNHFVLIYSKFYRLETYLMIIMALLNIVMSYFLIPLEGIAGAAIATCISVSIFNIVKSFLVFSLLKLQPFGKTHLVLILIALACFLLTTFLPDLHDPSFTLLYKAVVFSLLYFIPLIKYKISEEFNELLYQLHDRLMNLVGIRKENKMK